MQISKTAEVWGRFYLPGDKNLQRRLKLPDQQPFGTEESARGTTEHFDM